MNTIDVCSALHVTFYWTTQEGSQLTNILNVQCTLLIFPQNWLNCLFFIKNVSQIKAKLITFQQHLPETFLGNWLLSML